MDIRVIQGINFITNNRVTIFDKCGLK